jgi:hypothetical protein
MDSYDIFQHEGWVREADLLDMLALAGVESAIASVYLMQASKIAEYRHMFSSEEIAGLTPRETLIKVLGLLEQNDKEALYQVQKFLPQMQAVRQLFNHDFMDYVTHLIDKPERSIDPSLFLIEGPGLFINQPGQVRLLYKWHSEQHYYPRRRRFVNVWLPIFGNRAKENGAMSVLPRSHLRQWDFAEYQGYDKDTQGKKNHFVQYEVVESELSDFEPVTTDARRGEAVLFHRNMVHRSNHNLSDDFAFALVARVWTPVDDLTLAGHMAVTPYGGDPGGRPGLVGIVNEDF